MPINTTAGTADSTDTPVFDRARNAANDNHPTKQFDQPDMVETDDEPTGRGPVRTTASKAAAEMRRMAEKAAMASARAIIAKRQSIGNPDAENDNEVWPLLTALRREGDNDSIAFALRYRQLVALAECEPLQGQRLGGGDLGAVHRSTNLDAETDAAIANMQPGDTHLPGGEIRYKEAKQRKGGTFHIPARRAVSTNEETRVRTAPVAVKFNADLIVGKIDASRILDAVRAALGPLVEFMDDAVLGGQTYTQIGERRGHRVKPDVAGKALVREALLTADNALHQIDRFIRMAERQSDQRVLARRCQIAIERAHYLGMLFRPRG